MGEDSRYDIGTSGLDTSVTCTQSDAALSNGQPKLGIEWQNHFVYDGSNRTPDPFSGKAFQGPQRPYREGNEGSKLQVLCAPKVLVLSVER